MWPARLIDVNTILLLTSGLRWNRGSTLGRARKKTRVNGLPERRPRPFHSAWCLVWCWVLVAASLFAQEPDGLGEMQFFENEVRPLLAERCFACHGEKESNGELRLDSLAHILTGGESGAVIVPGKPAESLLIEAIRYESLEMPPDQRLSEREIAILTRWIAEGAYWPGGDATAAVRNRELFDEEDRGWWAIADLEKPKLPELGSASRAWAQNEIDYFIAERIESHSLTPAPAADKLALARRVFLDVTGIAPTPRQVAEFVDDDSPQAYANLVDRLLDSKAYGEHAARQWLDLVRYADSDGYRADEYRPDAFRYRDYVIRSFNADKGYDRFIQEQLAADELFPHDLDAQIGLGYLRHWVYEWNIRDAARSGRPFWKM